MEDIFCGNCWLFFVLPIVSIIASLITHFLCTRNRRWIYTIGSRTYEIDRKTLYDEEGWEVFFCLFITIPCCVGMTLGTLSRSLFTSLNNHPILWEIVGTIIATTIMSIICELYIRGKENEIVQSQFEEIERINNLYEKHNISSENDQEFVDENAEYNQ